MMFGMMFGTSLFVLLRIENQSYIYIHPTVGLLLNTGETKKQPHPLQLLALPRDVATLGHPSSHSKSGGDLRTSLRSCSQEIAGYVTMTLG
jgi:hypothetical protein